MRLSTSRAVDAIRGGGWTASFRKRLALSYHRSVIKDIVNQCTGWQYPLWHCSGVVRRSTLANRQLSPWSCLGTHWPSLGNQSTILFQPELTARWLFIPVKANWSGGRWMEDSFLHSSWLPLGYISRPPELWMQLQEEPRQLPSKRDWLRSSMPLH